MKILIIGHSGFVGRHLVPAIKDRLNPEVLHTVNTKDHDCTKPFCVSTMNTPLYLLHTKYDYIFHLATWTKAGDFGLKNPALQWEHNTLINSNILKYWRQAQPQAKMIALGSSCGYSYLDENKIEQKFLHGIPGEDVYYYAMSKRNLLIGLRSYKKQYDMKYVFFIPTTLYGPGFIDRDTHFIFDLVRKIVDARYQNKDNVTLWGDGNQIRGLLYIDDAVDTIINNIDTTEETINLKSTIHKPINYYVHIICKHIDYPNDYIHYDKNAFVGATSKFLPEHRTIPTVQNFTFDVGITQTIKYYKKLKGYK